MTDFAASLTPVAVPTLAGATAQDIANFQANFTSNIVATGNSLLQNYISLKDTDFYAVGDIPTLGTQLLFIDPDLFTRAKTSVPTRTDIDFGALLNKIDQLAAIAAPSAPTMAIPSVTTPDLTAVAPTIVLPAVPSADVGVAPSGAPSIDTPSMPDAPLIVLPNTPTFDELQLPVAPSISIPDWTASAPLNLLTPPTAQFSYVDPGYTSVLHDPLVAKLLLDLQNGTYGIEPADETGLWFRHRDRAAQQGRAAAEQARKAMAQTAFPLPQGAMFDAIAKEEQQQNEKLSEASREIALRRSELYVEGRKFTMEQVRQYEAIRISLYSATQERALNYSKAVVDTGIAIYDAGVKNYMAQLEGYKAEAAVFESRIRGELGKAEIFKSQIAAESLRATFNKSKLDLYLGQLSAINTTVDLYKSRLSAATLFMQLQGQKLDVFRSQVQAYSERVRAKEAEFNIYTATIKGQLAGIEIYKAQIDAYNATLAGVETKARVTLQGNEALLQQYKTASALYASQLDSFAKQISAKLDEARIRGSLYSADVDAYRAFVSSAMESARVQSDLNRYNLDWNKTALLSRVEQVRFRLDQLAKNVELQKDVNSHGIDFMRAALGGAVSGLNSLGTTSS